ncbi:MAG: DedA family protein [Opitutales bacterium]|nr:DedA family protein [Opitutales bacterium]
MEETPSQAAPKRNFIRRMYDWTVSWADTPYGMIALAVLAFAESSFFPIPPDVLLIPLVFCAPKKWWKTALVCTAFSVVGGIFGWYIGHFAWDSLKDFFFNYIPGFTQERFDYVQGLYREYGFLAVFGAAFTPIPYKIFTIAAGVFNLNLWTLVLASIAGRGGRFFVVSIIIYFVGERAKTWIDKYFNLAAIIFFILLIGGFALVKFIG